MKPGGAKAHFPVLRCDYITRDPLGMSGARIALSAVEELHRTGSRYALALMCIGVGQGLAMLMERV